MKKLLFITLLLVSCAGYQQRSRELSQRETTENHQTRWWEAQTGYRTFHTLDYATNHDSLNYRAWIRTDGPYRISTDSGIQGTGADIWLDGVSLRQRMIVTTQDSTARNVQLAAHTTEQRRSDTQTLRTAKSSSIKLNLYWLALPIILVMLLWYLWRRR